MKCTLSDRELIKEGYTLNNGVYTKVINSNIQFKIDSNTRIITINDYNTFTESFIDIIKDIDWDMLPVHDVYMGAEIQAVYIQFNKDSNTPPTITHESIEDRFYEYVFNIMGTQWLMNAGTQDRKELQDEYYSENGYEYESLFTDMDYHLIINELEEI